MSSMFTYAGTEQSEDGRELQRSPTMTAGGSVATGSSGSTSSDSVAVGGCTNSDHTVNDRHSTDEFISKISLPKGV